MLKRILRVVLWGLGVLLLCAAGGYVWVHQAAAGVLAKRYSTHQANVALPFPLAEAEAAEVSPDDVQDVAMERAIERGKHLVEARYACLECHGRDFGGGTMMDVPPVAQLFGPNLTGGKGSVVRDYTLADWDRIVRHGVKRDGSPAVMPSGDFFAMSDQELSDVVAYIRSMPPVDREMAPPAFGPVGKVLLATGQFRPSAEDLPDHQSAHAALPPESAETEAFGGHLAQVCTGCHAKDFAGGPVVGGDPSWVPAANLTPHAEGLAEWSYEDFVRALREGKGKNGTALRTPMDAVVAYSGKYSETEMKALWKYLRTVPPKPTPKG